jgi:biopolymer transport protein ExbD
MSLPSRRTLRRTDADPAVLVEINTTPLIDVMLVLLIMLIITIPIQLHSVNLNLPVGPPPPVREEPEVVRIDIDAAGVVRWQGTVLAGPDELAARMAAAAAQPVQPEIHLRPDRKARYDVVAGVLAASRRAGLTRLGVVGSEQFIE